MENNHPPEQRHILARIWDPKTQQDENLIRIIFWVSILTCLALPRLFENLEGNKSWEYITIAWLATAVFIRFRIYFKR